MGPSVDDHREVTIDQAAELMSVPAGTIRSWRGRREIMPCRFIPGRGPNGRVPLYVLGEIVQARQRIATRRRNRRDSDSGLA